MGMGMGIGRLGEFMHTAGYGHVAVHRTSDRGFFWKPSALSRLAGRFGGFGDVQFDLTGLQQHLSVRPMSVAYANGVISNAQGLISDQIAQGNVTPDQFDAQQALLSASIDVGASTQDPLANSVADEVTNAVLKAYGSANTVSTVLAQDVADKQATYQTLANLPSQIGQVIGQAANVPLQATGSALWTILQGVLANPTTWLVIGGAYLVIAKPWKKGSAT